MMVSLCVLISGVFDAVCVYVTLTRSPFVGIRRLESRIINRNHLA